MDVVAALERRIGGRWISIEFHMDSQPVEEPAESPMTVCEAVQEAYVRPLVLTPELVNCPGALHSLGWSKDDRSLSGKIMPSSDVAPEIESKLIENTPGIDRPVSAVTVGGDGNADLFVSCLQPVDVMNLIRRWQLSTGSDVEVSLSNVMAVCGNILARAYLSHKICMSFGCMSSTDKNKTEGNRLFVGIPNDLIGRIL